MKRKQEILILSGFTKSVLPSQAVSEGEDEKFRKTERNRALGNRDLVFITGLFL